MKTRMLKQGVLIGHICCGLLSTTALASSDEHQKCSEEFIGTVVHVEPKAPFTLTKVARESLAKEDFVEFKVDNSDQGHYRPTRSIVVEKAKNYKFEQGEAYLLGVEGDSLCNAEFIARR